MARQLMTPSECWAMLQGEESKERLLQTYLFGEDACGAFCNRAEYQRFRQEAAEAFESDFSAMSIVGSGRMGFSLSPDTKEDGLRKGRSPENAIKLWKPIHDGSDIDIVICDDALFEEAWTECLEYDEREIGVTFPRRYRQTESPPPMHRNIYQGVIIISDLPTGIPFLKRWSNAISAVSALSWDGKSRTCKGFVFHRRFHAEFYYRRSFQSIVKRIGRKDLPLPETA